MSAVSTFGTGLVPLTLAPRPTGPEPISQAPYFLAVPDQWTGQSWAPWQPAVLPAFSPVPYDRLLAQLDALTAGLAPTPPVLAPVPPTLAPPAPSLPVAPPSSPATPATPRPSSGQVSIPSDPRSWFISQNQGAFNEREDAPGNGNCGPTSLTMIARAFGKVNVTPDSANSAIEETRRRMGAGTRQQDEYSGTSFKQLERGAASYGLDSRVVWGGLDKLRKELADGRLVIAHVCATYLRPGTKTGHYAVVWKVEGDKVYLNDPANRKGPMVITTAQFLAAQKARGTHGLISIGP
ncbi:MAG: C39 family peptidase [Candidatus Sericytochromatia bacterium]|nr:C39 family peptidase [Candidatus Sericytochromatia bacterium]